MSDYSLDFRHRAITIADTVRARVADVVPGHRVSFGWTDETSIVCRVMPNGTRRYRYQGFDMAGAELDAQVMADMEAWVRHHADNPKTS